MFENKCDYSNYLFHCNKVRFISPRKIESFRSEIKDLFTVGYAVLLNAEVRNDEVRVSYLPS